MPVLPRRSVCARAHRWGGLAIAGTVTALAASPACATLGAQDTTRTTPAASTTPAAAARVFPAGAVVMVLSGDPAVAGPLMLALRIPDGYTLPPLAFARATTLTMMEGRFVLGRGERADGKGTTLTNLSAAQVLKAGGRIYGRARGQTTLQLEGEGPLDVQYAAAADDPRTRPAGP